MKKIMTFVITLMLLISSTVAYGALPEFMTKNYDSYTVTSSISFSFENSTELIDALTSELDNHFLQVVDLGTILKEVFTETNTIDLQADISPDCRKVNLAMTSKSFNDINVSQNLNIKVDSKAGMWLKMALTTEEPVFEITAVSPISNKYLYYDIMEIITEEEKANFMELANEVFTAEFVGSMKKAVLDVFEENADIKLSGNTCTIKLDNQGLIAILDRLFHNFWEYTNKLAIPNSTEEIVYDGPDFTGVRFLGENGIVCKITLSGGNPVKVETVADISLNIFEAVTLEDGSVVPDVKFTFKETDIISKINSTVVKFPTLNEENSVDLTDQYKRNNASEEYYDEYIYIPQYPHYWAWAETPANVAANHQFYIPLRGILEYAYEDTVEFTYCDGTITATSDNFDGFSVLTLTEGSEIVFTDDVSHQVGTVIVEEGVTYVSCALFENCFNWNLTCAQKNLLTGDCTYEFITETY